MELNTIIEIVTVVVTLVCGFLAKKYKKFNNKLIPVQNLLIGLIAGIIYYLITKNVDLVITSLGLFTGGTYDVANNLLKLRKEVDNEGSDL